MAFPPNWPFLFLTSSNTEPQVLTGYSGSLTHTIGIFIHFSFCSSLDKDWNKVNVFDWILSELDLLLWNQTTHVLSFFLLCMCLTSSLAEEKAREAESKARALELKIGDDLSKEARVRRHNHPNTHTHTHTLQTQNWTISVKDFSVKQANDYKNVQWIRIDLGHQIVSLKHN